MLNIGDKVKFLNAPGGGKVTQLIDKDTVMVLSEIDDFEIPVLLSELILMDKREVADKKEFSSGFSALRSGTKKEVLLVFSAEGDEHIAYLVNFTEQIFVFAFYEEKKQSIEGVFSGMLQPDSVQEVRRYVMKDLDDILQWKVQGFHFCKHPKEVDTPIDCVVKMKAKKIFKSGNKKFIDAIGKEAIVFPLTKAIEQKSIESADLFSSSLPERKTVADKKKQPATSGLLEIDLHIHELLETTKGMSNGEILEYQLDTFRKILIENKKNKGKKIVFIHGVGNGVLKQRIRHELQKYPQYLVQDASFQEYGWGATMVTVK